MSSNYRAYRAYTIMYFPDMGQAQLDDTQVPPDISEPGAINTTNCVKGQVDVIDMVLHIGDISYARGYAGVVRTTDYCCHCCLCNIIVG